jgi:hypothetical protein
VSVGAFSLNRQEGGAPQRALPLILLLVALCLELINSKPFDIPRYSLGTDKRHSHRVQAGRWKIVVSEAFMRQALNSQRPLNVDAFNCSRGAARSEASVIMFESAFSNLAVGEEP